MADLHTNLFKVRRKRTYDARKSAVDNRKNLGNDYTENALKNSISPYIFRNKYMNDFVTLIQLVVSDLVDAVTTLKLHKSYTHSKRDKKVR